MKTRRFLALSGLLATALALPFGGHANGDSATASSLSAADAQARLVLTVDGLKSSEGQVLAGLYDTAEGFEAEQDLMGRTVPVSASSVEIVFDNLSPGEYALKVFHDEDGDGELDTNVLGIPSEPYGFSNNASDPFSAPEWKETRFTVNSSVSNHRIDLD